jgi:hypothetical protein
MPLVAKASKTVRNKNLIIVAMCAVFFVWFTYDGYVTYPAANDAAMAHWGKMFEENTLNPSRAEDVDPWRDLFKNWPGWKNASSEQRQRAQSIDDDVIRQQIRSANDKWYSPLTASLQIWLAWGLAGAVIASIWWLIHCQKRRATADDATVSPAKNVTIPWENITTVDNTRWKHGIVTITYRDASGAAQKAEFDDYKLDREPLLAILDLLADKATKAEFIPKEELAAAPAPPPPAA